MKKLLTVLDNVALASIGYSNTTFNFMTKYHENHSYENCRLIKINEHFSSEVWREILKKIGLDLLCVSAHYSNRYESSDKFIDNKSDEELKSYVYYLKNTSATIMLKDFCSKYIVHTNDESKMEWKNLHFVWKQFLSNLNLPNVIYSNTLKNMLKELYLHDEQSDSFSGITSKYVPIQSDFIKFWENAITYYTGTHNFDYEFEIDELCSLFKTWSKQNSEFMLTTGNITEQNVLKILKHFYPNITIIEDKYVLNIKCSLWDKNNDIDLLFDYVKEQINSNSNMHLISFDDAYNYYYKFCNLKSNKFVVNKRYFEKYLYYKIPQHIVYEKFIETSWILTLV
jgi:hypothetical protein